MTGQHIDISAGDRAPDACLWDEEGDEVQLATFWRERPVALVFVRHFG